MTRSFYSDLVWLFSLVRSAWISGGAPHHQSLDADGDRCPLRRFKSSYFFHRGVTQL
jgi:hypothetical protein